jgi:DNA polymerase-3 subunit beta
MKFTVNQSELKKALYTVLPALPNKTTMPVLQMIHMQTDGNLLTIKATNLEMTIVTTMNARVEKQGVILVEGKLFSDLVGNFPNQTVEVSSDLNKQCNIVCGKSKSDLHTMDADDYPDVSIVCKSQNYLAEFNPSDFKSSLQKVVIAAAQTDSRPILAGVHFQFDSKNKGVFHMTATDGFRLSQKSEKYIFDKDINDSQFIVPINFIENLLKLVNQGIEKVEIFYTESAVGFRLVSVDNETFVMGRQISGTYPAVSSIIPKTIVTDILVSKSELQKALKIVKLFAIKSNNIIGMNVQQHSVSFDAADGKGENTTEIEATVLGPEMKLSLNVLFLEELANIIATEKVIIRTIDPTKPITFKEHNESETEFTHVIMPIMKK